MTVEKIEVTGEMIEKAKGLAETGAPMKVISAILGMSKATAYNKFNEYPEFKKAYYQGKAVATAEVIGKLFEKCMDGDYSSIQFYLRNNCPDEYGDLKKIALESTTPALAYDLSGVSDAAILELASAPVLDTDTSH